MNKRLQVIKYVVADFLLSILAWALFFSFRKYYIEINKYGNQIAVTLDDKFLSGLILIPLFWVIIFAMTGAYNDIYRRSRLKETVHVFFTVIIGVTILFFAVILDDDITNYKNYYESYIVLFCLQFFLIASGRLILSSITAYKIHNRIIGFKTIIIGSNENALTLFEELEGQKQSTGFKFIGYVHINGGNGSLLSKKLQHLGHYKDIDKILANNEDVEEVIIALETSEHGKLGKIISEMEDHKVKLKVIPDMYDILSGSVKMSAIFGIPLIEIHKTIMPPWEKTLKRLFDIVFSVIAIVILLPVYLILAILIKLTSEGPILYSHERIGKNGKPFIMYKFRSMYKDAEKNGPALSSKNDNRITPLGKFLRQTRLDETPQFFNVLKGDMAIVGPRPERKYFIDQIILRAPHYKHLHKVRPGITSWGQVKYGYAENVDQMIQRLKYDVLYIENMSIIVDLKILIYTVLIVLQGRGK